MVQTKSRAARLRGVSSPQLKWEEPKLTKAYSLTIQVPSLLKLYFHFQGRILQN